MQKRYLLFAGADYYPGGGLNDLVGFYATKEEALSVANACAEWWHILDVQEMKVVALQGNLDTFVDGGGE